MEDVCNAQLWEDYVSWIQDQHVRAVAKCRFADDMRYASAVSHGLRKAQKLERLRKNREQTLHLEAETEVAKNFHAGQKVFAGGSLGTVTGFGLAGTILVTVGRKRDVKYAASNLVPVEKERKLA